MESLPSFEELVQTLIGTQFQQDVYVFTILKEVLELAHIRILDTPVNFDFAHELLFGSAFD